MTAEARPARARAVIASLRFRICAVAAVGTFVVLAAVGVGVVVAQQRLLVEDLEDALVSRADEVARMVTAGSLPTTLPAGGDQDDSVVQVVSTSGDVIASSANLAGRPPIADDPGRDTTELTTVEELPVGDGPFRLLSRRVEGPAGPVVVHAAASLEDVHESGDALTAALVVALPAAALVLAGLTWWLVGRTLRPVEAIRVEVDGIDGDQLARRVPEPGTGDEIDRLARTMNAMLERVEQAVRREQHFVADASHELRSPLTRIRSELEVDAAHPATADLAATHRSVSEEVVAMQRLVEDLLHLARSDAGVGRSHREPVDLDDLVLREADRVRAAGRVSVDLGGVTAAQVRGDPDQLARLVGNVVDNAARHARSVVSLSLGERDGQAVLTVTDDGPGIPAASRERVFERFARLDQARSTATGGTGLGLAIARDIVERHGGAIAVAAHGPPGARFVVTLPTP